MALEDDAAVRARTCHGFAVQPDFSLGRRKKTGDDGKQSCFSATRSANGDDKFPIVDGEIDVGQSLDNARGGLIADAKIAYFELWHEVLVFFSTPKNRIGPGLSEPEFRFA